AEIFREPASVAAGLRRRVTRRHRDAVDALRAERLDGQRGRERGVDPAGDADDHVAEPVLVDVVAKTELEGEPHPLEPGELRGDHRLHRLAVPTRRRRGDVDDRYLGPRAPLPGERAAP